MGTHRSGFNRSRSQKNPVFAGDIREAPTPSCSFSPAELHVWAERLRNIRTQTQNDLEQIASEEREVMNQAENETDVLDVAATNQIMTIAESLANND